MANRRFKCIHGNDTDFKEGLIYTLNNNDTVDTNSGVPISTHGHNNAIEYLECEYSFIRFEEVFN